MQPIPSSTSPGVEGPWLLTVSGRRFDLLEPDPKSIDLGDIAWALSNIRRFTGHTSRPWSVAEHSILVSSLLSGAGESTFVQRIGLIHDAAEAYLGDVATPLKRAMELVGPRGAFSPFDQLEARVERAIFRALRVWPSDEDRAAVKAADNVALGMEARAFMPPVPGLLWAHPTVELPPQEPSWVVFRTCRMLGLPTSSEPAFVFKTLWDFLRAEEAKPYAA